MYHNTQENYGYKQLSEREELEQLLIFGDDDEDDARIEELFISIVDGDIKEGVFVNGSFDRACGDYEYVRRYLERMTELDMEISDSLADEMSSSYEVVGLIRDDDTREGKKYYPAQYRDAIIAALKRKKGERGGITEFIFAYAIDNNEERMMKLVKKYSVTVEDCYEFLTTNNNLSSIQVINTLSHIDPNFNTNFSVIIDILIVNVPMLLRRILFSNV